MNLKIVKYHQDDLIISAKDISANLNRVCTARALKWEVSGFVHKHDTIMVCLDEVSVCRNEYFFAEVEAGTVESLEQEIKSHWQSGIFLMGLIHINEEECLALFRREK